MKHDTMLVQFQPYNESPQLTTFGIAGLDEVAGPLPRSCVGRELPAMQSGTGQGAATTERVTGLLQYRPGGRCSPQVPGRMDRLVVCGSRRGSDTILLLALWACSWLSCAAHRPGARVTRDFAEACGCDFVLVMAEARKLEGGLESATLEYIPRVGWDACEVLAHNGRPTRVDHHESESGRSMSWWYQSDAETHLITLRQHPGRPGACKWVVDYVGW